MNKTKLNIYKKVLHEVCQKFNGAEEFINQKIEEICCHEKLLVEEVTYYFYERQFHYQLLNSIRKISRKSVSHEKEKEKYRKKELTQQTFFRAKLAVC